jgi:hypothetical protein
MLSRRFSVEVTGISYPLLTFTYHGGRGSAKPVRQLSRAKRSGVRNFFVDQGTATLYAVSARYCSFGDPRQNAGAPAAKSSDT